MQKTCNKCGVLKAVSEFHSRKERPIGIRGSCRTCLNALSKERALRYYAARARLCACGENKIYNPTASKCRPCSKKLQKKPSAFTMKGRKQSEKHHLAVSGANHWNWKGGISHERDKVLRSPEYVYWRKHVFQRDDYTCQGCGARGVYLEADHELPWSLYPHLRYEILNGRTFCKPCHYKYGWNLFREDNPRKRYQHPPVYKI